MMEEVISSGVNYLGTVPPCDFLQNLDTVCVYISRLA